MRTDRSGPGGDADLNRGRVAQVVTMREFQGIRVTWVPMPTRPYRLQWEDGEMLSEWRGERKGRVLTFATWEAAFRTIRKLPHRIIFSKPKERTLQ